MSFQRVATYGLLAALAIAVPTASSAGQDPKSHRGRKYKAPPETSHIEVIVTRGDNHKPILNAAVVFHPTKDGKDEGNLEVKTNEQGRAVIDVIPVGSLVGVQVIADGFATFAGDFKVAEMTREIPVAMIKPRAQISTYVETHGQASQRPAGVQEAIRPTSAPVTQTPLPTSHTSEPSPRAPGAVNAPTTPMAPTTTPTPTPTPNSTPHEMPRR